MHITNQMRVDIIPHMKIIFLNIYGNTIKDLPEAFIEAHKNDTDIFCLQESYEKTKWLLRNILNDYAIVSDYKYIDDNENFPQTTYIRKNIEIKNTQTIMKDTPETGLALHTQLLYKNKLINICNVHGIAKPGNKLDTTGRLVQSQTIIDFYKNIEGIKIVGGDFNLETTTKSVNIFEESGYINLIKKYSITTTRNRIVWEKYPDNKQYFSDYVFADPNVKMQSFEVPNNEISDHLPMIVNIEL